MFSTSSLPIVEELHPVPDAADAFLRLRALPHCLWFDSARKHPTLGRYSFLMAQPFDYIELPIDGPDALTALAERLAPYHSASLSDLPPFQGGAAGLISYDLGRQLERLPAPRIDEFQVPAMAFGVYDVVVAWDHEQGRAWIISHGWPERGEARLRRAQARLDEFRGYLTGEPKGIVRSVNGSVLP